MQTKELSVGENSWVGIWDINPGDEYEPSEGWEDLIDGWQDR